MSVTVDLSEKELEELKRLTREEDPSAVVRKAVEEYIRFIQRQQLLELPGRVQMQDNWQKLEESELSGQDD